MYLKIRSEIDSAIWKSYGTLKRDSIAERCVALKAGFKVVSPPLPILSLYVLWIDKNVIGQGSSCHFASLDFFQAFSTMMNSIPPEQ